jgi:zinc transport system permease protein
MIMTEFFHAIAGYSFMVNALVMGGLAGVACGIVGTYVVARRITFIAGSIAHAVLGGMGAARYFAVTQEWSWLQPLHGATIAALAAALTIGWVSLHAREREDTVIGAIWAIGMAVGILFISQTPGYNDDLMSYLFGNILMVGRQQLILIGALDAVVLFVVVLFYHKLTAVCFDEEFARVRGINVKFFYLLLLALTGLTVVILVSVVGLILVIALLTLPVAIAGQFFRTIGRTMVAASILAILFTVLGLAFSYQPDLPVGATIIMVAGAIYLVVTLINRLRRRHP